MRINSAILKCGVAISMFTYSGVMRAQNAHLEAGANSDDDVKIEEIVVTAQKRQQSANSVGLTITAASADALSTRGVTDTGDLAKIVSGFNASRGPYSTPVYTLRGIGLFESSLGSSPAVAVYVDEIALPFPVTQVGAALDVERVEVLKGPQGTLFGESSTGGAINYVAAKPTDRFAAGATISYERFGRADVEGFVSGPITESLKARAAVRATQGGAWQYSVTRPDDKNGDTRQLLGRLLLDWTPTDRLKVLVNANGWRDRSDSQQGQFRFNELNTVGAPGSVNPFAVVDPALFASLTTPGNPNYNPSFLSRQAVLFGRLTGLGFAPGAVIYPDDPAMSAAYLGGPNGDGTAVTGIRAAEWTPGFTNRSDNNFLQSSARIEFDITDGMKITSATSYQRTNIDNNLDSDATITDAFQTNYSGRISTFSQELRLSGQVGGLNWIVGGNYANSKISDRFLINIRNVAVSEILPGLRFAQVDSRVEQRIKTSSVFGNVDYKLGNLTAMGGIRYTKSNADANYCNIDPSSNQSLSKLFGNADVVPGFGFYDLQTAFGLDPAGHRVVLPGQCYAINNLAAPTDPGFLRPIIDPYPQKLHEDNVSWRLGVNYKIDQGTLLYATVSQGYKAGIIAGISPSTVDQYAPAKQEKVIAYEAGFKAPLADRRIQLNGAAFYYDYRSKQLRARVLDNIFGLLETVVNVPKSRIWGLEGELVMRPVDGLDLSGSLTYLNSKVTSKFDNVNGRLLYNQQGYAGDFKGSKLPFTPKFSSVADAQYTFAARDGLNAFFGGTLTYQDKVNATFETPTVKADRFVLRSHVLLDLRAGLEGNDGAWRLMVYGRNVTNKYYEVGVYNGAESNVAYAGRPAVYGLQLTLRTK